MEQRRLPDRFWNEHRGRWDSHVCFDTISHHHVSDYSGDITCDIMIVECRDGRWFIEDNWGADAPGIPDVFHPHDKTEYPTFFESFASVNQRAAEIVHAITGAPVEELLIEDD